MACQGLKKQDAPYEPLPKLLILKGEGQRNCVATMLTQVPLLAESATIHVEPLGLGLKQQLLGGPRDFGVERAYVGIHRLYKYLILGLDRSVGGVYASYLKSQGTFSKLGGDISPLVEVGLLVIPFITCLPSPLSF